MQGIWPLINLYPECPLAVFFDEEWKTNHVQSKDEALKILKMVAEDMLDRRERFGMFVQATAVYLDCATGKMHLPMSMKDFDLNNIADYPHTDESQKMASFVRAAINGYGMLQKKESHNTWSDYFWNRGLEISPCEAESDTYGI